MDNIDFESDRALRAWCIDRAYRFMGRCDAAEFERFLSVIYEFITGLKEAEQDNQGGKGGQASKDFSQLKRLFDGEVERVAQEHLNQRLDFEKTDMARMQAKYPVHAAAVIKNSQHYGLKCMIARLLDGCDMATAKSVLRDAADLFDKNHKVQAENI